MPETYTLDEVSRLMSTLIDGIRTGETGDDRVYSLPEVSNRTGFALRQLREDCRADLVEHVHRGDFRGMTSRQIAILVARHSSGGDLASRTSPRGALAAALEMTRNSGAKRASRVRAR
jgi:hypothetical protein